MKKENDTPALKGLDHTQGHNHVTVDPHAANDIHHQEDKRKEVRQEHTNHFTNRQGHPEKK